MKRMLIKITFANSIENVLGLFKVLYIILLTYIKTFIIKHKRNWIFAYHQYF